MTSWPYRRRSRDPPRHLLRPSDQAGSGADGFGSWLLQRVHEDGGWDSTFWVRITAADGLLRVSGDFNPVVFAHGPRDPRSCVAWMGSHEGLDPYVLEKAKIGTGGADRLSKWSVDSAKDDLRELLDEAKGEDPEPKYEAGLREALRTSPDYDGYLGCVELQRVVLDADHDAAWEHIGSVGRRPAGFLELAHLAVRRLHELLTEDEHG